jgi:hypothetical protein
MLKNNEPVAGGGTTRTATSRANSAAATSKPSPLSADSLSLSVAPIHPGDSFVPRGQERRFAKRSIVE